MLKLFLIFNILKNISKLLRLGFSLKKKHYFSINKLDYEFQKNNNNENKR